MLPVAFSLRRAQLLAAAAGLAVVVGCVAGGCSIDTNGVFGSTERDAACEVLGDCNACATCAISEGGPCADAYAAAINNPESGAYTDCINGCGGTQDCRNGCADAYPNGAAAYETYAYCVNCEACLESCEGALQGC
ncbi:MAG: hypothetical protein U0271_16505 [Polyangiaceae bacterium]